MPPGVKGRQTAPIEVPECVTFRPTWEEFKDFNKYVRYLESVGAHKAGIAKVVPPKEWVPRKNGYNLEDFNLTIETPVKQYFKQVGARGEYQTKGIIKQPMAVLEYHKLATSSQYRTPNHTSYDDLERKYWKSLSFCPPIYGCDVADSITDEDQEEWNIRNLKSILNLVSEDYDKTIKGVNSPYLYFGMWKATFSWHVEDMDLHSINYLHHGAPKTWYCIPPQYGHLMEKAARKMFPNVASWCSNFMRHKTCLMSPWVLDKMGVPYQKVVQEENNAIIVFPYAYHSGFNHGFNIAESTNFALERWIEYGKRARQCDCARSRVVFSMDTFVKKFQPEKYDGWRAGTDIEPHPEDPPEVVEEIRLRAEDPAEYRRMMQDRLKPRGKSMKPRTTCPLLETDAKTRGLQVYQHHELFKVRVALTEDLQCYKGLEQLKEFLEVDGYPYFRDLIDRGTLIHVGEEVFAAKDLKEPEFYYQDVLVFKNQALGIEANVHPVTKELVGDQSKDLDDLLSVHETSMKEQIDSGAFTLDYPAMTFTPNPNFREEPAAKRMKEEEPVTTEAFIYKHMTLKELITVNPRGKIVGKLPSADIIHEVEGKTLRQLLEAGTVIKVGVRMVRLMRDDGNNSAGSSDEEVPPEESSGESEAYTSDEPSESDVETSDDPDFKSGREFDWSSKKTKKKIKTKGTEILRSEKRVVSRRHALTYDTTLETVKFIVRLEAGKIMNPAEVAEKLDLDEVGVRAALEAVKPFRAVEECGSSFRWKGTSQQEMETFLQKVYHRLVRSSTDVARITRDLLTLAMKVRRGQRLYIPMVIHERFMRDQGADVNRALAVMEGLGLVAERDDYAGGLEYIGPDIDAEERSRVFQIHRHEHGLKDCGVRLKRQELGPDVVLPPIQKYPERLISRHKTCRPAAWDDEKIMLERERSIRYKDVLCKCGSSKEVINKGGRTRVHLGFKKRSRCQHCDACSAPKCMKCAPCLRPPLKKPCVNKVCLYPIVPYCPCYQ